MKTKLTLTLLLSFSFYLLSSQIPQGFNYQAIARNGSGQAITDPFELKITILSKITPPEVVVYKETFTSVDPDEHGLFSIVVGSGTPEVGSFGSIDWTLPELYIRTTIGGVVLVPDTRLWSVPYTMVADDLTGPLKKLTVDAPSTSLPEDVLFEVKNNEDKTVFAVYNDGVSIHVGPRTAKGAKGGFSVGGFDNSKDVIGQKYLFADPAGVNIFIDDNPLKGAKGGFSVGGFDAGKLGSNFFDVSVDATGTVAAEVNRILWYPVKNAFLSGRILIPSATEVGENSFATGFKAKAKGMYSQSMGYLTEALGDYSTAIGKNAIANNNNSFAFGDGARALNQDAYAFGALTEAQGTGSFAFGYVGRDSLGATGNITKAVGNYSFALGLGAQTGATAEGAFAIGSGTNAVGKFSLAMGYKSNASEYYSMAIGNYALASGGQAIALGASSDAIGSKSLAIFGYAEGSKSISIGEIARSLGPGSLAIGGYMTSPPTIVTDRASAEGLRSIAIGSGVAALGSRSVSIGTGQYGELLIPAPPIFPGTANASYSFAIGTDVISSGNFATSMGRVTTAQAYNSFVIGRYNVVEGTTGSWVNTEPLFVVGNGSSTSNRSNAFTIRKDGLTESSGTFRVLGATYPTVGVGVEIIYDPVLPPSGQAIICAIDRATSSYKPVYLYSGTIRPVTNDVYTIGTSTLRYATIYAADGTINTSDLRMKDNIQSLTRGLEEVLRLNPVSFTWKNRKDGTTRIGLVAQEVLPLIPEVVDTGNDPDKILGINYAGLVPVLINAIQEQQRQIDELKSLVNKLISEKE